MTKKQCVIVSLLWTACIVNMMVLANAGFGWVLFPLAMEIAFLALFMID